MSVKNEKTTTTNQRKGQNSANYVIIYNLAKPTLHFRKALCGYTQSNIIVRNEKG